jgi:hypothetical protein
MNKEKILAEIKRTTLENGGQPLGVKRFSKETGISEYAWHEYWPRFSAALAEAGFAPNRLTVAYPDELMIEKLVGLIRVYKRFPTASEMRIARKSDPSFPSASTYDHFGTKVEKAKKIIAYLDGKEGYEDIKELCSEVLKAEDSSISSNNELPEIPAGEVYLFKSGRYYKIGMTKDIVRRGTEIKIQLPERIDLIHSIATDDPSGVEAYWHRRFASKRMNGEWVDLSGADVRAFKRWRKIF